MDKSPGGQRPDTTGTRACGSNAPPLHLHLGRGPDGRHRHWIGGSTVIEEWHRRCGIGADGDARSAAGMGAQDQRHSAIIDRVEE